MSILNDINNFDPDKYDSESENDDYDTDSSVDSSDTSYDEYEEDDYSPHNFMILSNQNNRLKTKLSKINDKLKKEELLCDHLKSENSKLEGDKINLIENVNKMLELNNELNERNNNLIKENNCQKRQNFFYLEIIGTLLVSSCVGALYFYKSVRI